MDTAGEWRRQRAWANYQAEFHSGRKNSGSNEAEANGSASESNPPRPATWSRMHRFMPPPATYHTPIDSSASSRESLNDYSMLGEDLTDAFAIQSTTHGIQGQQPYATDHDMDDDESSMRMGADGELEGEHGSTMQSSHSSPAAAAAAAAAATSASITMGAPSQWMPVRSAAHGYSFPSSLQYQQRQVPRQWNDTNQHPFLQHSPQRQTPSHHQQNDAAAASSSSMSDIPAGSFASDPYSTPPPSRKRGRTPSTDRSSVDSESPAADANAQANDDARRKSRKRFNKQHQTPKERERVQTQTVVHSIVRDADETEQAYMRPVDAAHSSTVANEERASEAATASSSAAASSAAALAGHSSSSSSSSSSVSDHAPSAPSSPGSVSSTVSTSFRWTTRGPNSSAQPSPQRGRKQKNQSSPMERKQSPQTGWKLPTPAPLPLNLTTPKPLVQTGALWIQDYPKHTTLGMTDREIEERIALLQSQKPSENMSLTPIFFSMGLSLLIRQKSIKRDMIPPLVELIQTAVDHRLVPAALNPRITEHVRDFAKRLTHLSAPLSARVTGLATNMAQQMNTPGTSAAAGLLRHARPGVTTGNRQPRPASAEEFQMLGMNRGLYQPTQCPHCGVGVLGTTATYVQHVHACAAFAKRRTEFAAAQMPTVAFHQYGVKVSQPLEEAWPPPAQARRFPSLSSSFVPAAPSKEAKSAPSAASASTAGTSFNDAISIDDSDEDDSPKTVEEIAKKQRLSLEEALSFVRASFAADDLIHSQKLPFADPLTLTRIEVPVRAKQCSHIRCCDLAVMVQHAQDVSRRNHKLKCPICQIEMQLADLIVDSFLELRLKEADSMPNVSEITLHRDCTFEFGSTGSNAAAASSSANPSLTRSQSDPSARALTLTKQTSDGSSKKNQKQVVHVDLLDSDEEEEDDKEEDSAAQAEEARKRAIQQQRRAAEKRPMGRPSSPQAQITKNDTESDSSESEEQSSAARSSPVSRRSHSPTSERSSPVSRPHSRASETSELSRRSLNSRALSVTPTPGPGEGGFSSGDESSSVPNLRANQFQPRSAWNRPDVLRPKFAPRQVINPPPVTVRPRAQLAPAPAKKGNSAPREADIDLTLTSSSDSSDSEVVEVEEAPKHPVQAPKVESLDSRTAAIDALPARKPSPPLDAEDLLMRLGNGEDMQVSKITRDEIGTTENGVDLNVFSPDFLNAPEISPLITAAANASSPQVIERKEPESAASNDSVPVHPPSFPSSAPIASSIPSTQA